jgi:micrococcal nuclease
VEIVRRSEVIALVALGVGALAGCRGDDGSSSSPPNVAVVTRIVDGDTIDVEVGGNRERVRLIGIDTPELHTAEGPPECMAVEAREQTAELLAVGREVRLERDLVGRDDYGRLLAYVFRRDDDLFVNEAIVAGGFARPLTIAPNDAYRPRFVAAATAAADAGLGLWQACGG